MLEKFKVSVFQALNEIFAIAAVDEMAGDMGAYKDKLNTIASVAETLGIATEITSITINIKSGEADKRRCQNDEL